MSSCLEGVLHCPIVRDGRDRIFYCMTAAVRKLDREAAIAGYISAGLVWEGLHRALFHMEASARRMKTDLG